MIIGILTIPSDKTNTLKFKNSDSYITAYYVDKLKKYAEVQIIPYNTDDCEYYFKKINGLYFPGGRRHNNKKFLDTYTKLFTMAIQENDKGNYFPVFASCLGFQYLIKMVTDKPVLQKYDNSLNNKKKLSFHNTYGLKLDNYKHIKHFYKVVDTSMDKNNDEFVSGIKAHKYPFYGYVYTLKKDDDLFLLFINECKKNNRKNKKIKEIDTIILDKYYNASSKFAYAYGFNLIL